LTILLQLSTQSNLCDAVIRLFTRSEYSHVDFVMPNGDLFGAHPLKGVSRRAPGPVARRLLLTADAPARVLEIAEGELGKPYDYTAVFSQIIFGRDWQRPDSWFCSELIAWCFQEAGFPLFPPHVTFSLITPRDLLLSARLHRL